MKSKEVFITGVILSLCVAVPAVAVDVERGLVVCIGADALESVANDWKKPGATFYCLEASDQNPRKIEATETAS